MRGTATTPARAQGMVVALDGNRGTIELTIRPTTARRLDLDLLLVSNTPERLGASLRLVRADGEELVAARPVTPQELASFRDLAPGRYVLGLSTSPEIRIPLVIEEDG